MTSPNETPEAEEQIVLPIPGKPTDLPRGEKVAHGFIAKIDGTVSKKIGRPAGKSPYAKLGTAKMLRIVVYERHASMLTQTADLLTKTETDVVRDALEKFFQPLIKAGKITDPGNPGDHTGPGEYGELPRVDDRPKRVELFNVDGEEIYPNGQLVRPRERF